MKNICQRGRIIPLLALLILQASASNNKKEQTIQQERNNNNNKHQEPRRSLLSQLADNREEQRDLIVGGKQANPGDFPYYVHLMICGGSLISPKVVLTAAHCGRFDGNTVYVGCHEYGEATGDTEVRVVADQIIHPDYNQDLYTFDFNLLLLNETVTIEDHTDIVLTLNEDDLLPADGQEVTVLGLGLLEEDGETPDFVRYVEVEKTADENCNKAYDGSIEDSVQFCAGVDGGGKDACQGDSGGPLVVEYGNEHIQVGVVSSGTGCADPDYPGIYARVSGQIEWIRSVVCDEWNQTDATFCPNYAASAEARTGRSSVVKKPRSQPPDWFRIQSKDVEGDDGTPYCLALEDGNVATNGEPIVMLPCDGTFQQQWTQFDNDYFIRSKMNPNKCIDSDGELLQLYDCFEDDITAFEAWSDGTIRLLTNSSKCWEYSMEESKTILTDCSDDVEVSQQWKTTFRQEDLLRAKNAAKEALNSKHNAHEEQKETKHAEHEHKEIRVDSSSSSGTATSMETKHAEHKDIRDSSTTTPHDPRAEEDEDDSTWFGLKNVKTDTCLTLHGSTADLTVLSLEDCSEDDSSDAEQLWRFMEGGELQTKLDTSKCVVPSGEGAMGDAMLVYECDGQSMYGEWGIPAFDDAEDAIGPVVSKEDSSKCLASHASDNVVILEHCAEDEDHIRDDRLWEIV